MRRSLSLLCLIIIKSCYFDYRRNKLFARSRCVIYVSWSRHTTCAKDHGLFCLNYPQINEVGKSYHVIWFRPPTPGRFPYTFWEVRWLLWSPLYWFGRVKRLGEWSNFPTQERRITQTGSIRGSGIKSTAGYWTRAALMGDPLSKL